MPQHKKVKGVKPSNMPDITIERILYNGTTGHLTNLDVHDENTGYAYFLKVVGCHYHGKYGSPLSPNKKGQKKGKSKVNKTK